MFEPLKTQFPGMMTDTEFQKQARLIGSIKLGMLSTRDGLLSSQFPPDSLVVANPAALQAMAQNGPRSLALLFSQGKIYPAIVSWKQYDANNRWRVYVRHFKAENSMEVLDKDITCAMFGPDLKMVLEPPPPEDQLTRVFLQQVTDHELETDFQKSVKTSGTVNPFKVAVAAADRNRMPKLPIPEGYFDFKEKMLPFSQDLRLYVRYHSQHRKFSYDNSRIFESVFSGDRSDQTKANMFLSFRGLMQTIGVLQAQEQKQGETPTPAAFAYLLSEKRFAMGWPKDGVEIGTGHNCLIQDEDEQVYIAGEILFSQDLVLFNFNSGTFTRQIAPEYFAGEAAFMRQWQHLIKQLITTSWDTHLSRILHKDLQVPNVAYTEKVLLPLTPPVKYTIQAFCHSEPWMATCACISHFEQTGGQRYVNYCDFLSAMKEVTVKLCNLHGCHP